MRLHLHLVLVFSVAGLVSAGCPFQYQLHGMDASQSPHHAVNNSLTTPRSLKSSSRPDPGQKTVQGCTCISACGASVDDLYRCDWCKTADGCGHKRFLGGSYDYCDYAEDDAFEAQSWQQKTAYFWDKVTADPHGDSAYASKTVILTESSITTFDNMKDELPAGRVKGIHTIGAICQFNLSIPDASPYTGMFAGGDQIGLVRMGGAVAYASGGFPPGIGVKFARSGVHSANYVALNSLDASTFNFFGLNMSNHIGSPSSIATKLLVKKFQQASQCAPQVGLSDLAKYDQSGRPVPANEVRFPFKLFLVPSEQVQFPNTQKTVAEVNSELESIKVGTPLYTVWACGSAAPGGEDNPTSGGLEKACGSKTRLGEMVTTTPCTTSKYGDEKFFIRHQRVEEDWALEPSYLAQYDASTACDWKPAPTVQGVPKKCH